MALRDRVLTEITPADAPVEPSFADDNDHEYALKPGDSFLIPKES
ncbi:MAG: hypothetical protein M2R45_01581 [Verrucomicrobia subdivision 3 bacterium]|nr:hypothetical protein [Limisphaerales bacterium]MCS1412734.1 hypothetical protein [Limisphaerales bacterium]